MDDHTSWEDSEAMLDDLFALESQIFKQCGGSVRLMSALKDRFEKDRRKDNPVASHKENHHGNNRTDTSRRAPTFSKASNYHVPEQTLSDVISAWVQSGGEFS